MTSENYGGGHYRTRGKYLGEGVSLPEARGLLIMCCKPELAE